MLCKGETSWGEVIYLLICRKQQTYLAFLVGYTKKACQVKHLCCTGATHNNPCLRNYTLEMGNRSTAQPVMTPFYIA